MKEINKLETEIMFVKTAQIDRIKKISKEIELAQNHLDDLETTRGLLREALSDFTNFCADDLNPLKGRLAEDRQMLIKVFAGLNEGKPSNVLLDVDDYLKKHDPKEGRND